MTVTTEPIALEVPAQQDVIMEKPQEVPQQSKVPKKTQYYKGTLSSPFAMEVIGKMGFVPLPDNMPKDEWAVNLFPTKDCDVKPANLKKMKEGQRHSRFPESDNITKKNKLAKSFRKMEKRGVSGLDFLPQTFVLPDDWKAFIKCMNAEKAETDKAKEKEGLKVRGPWIIKPPNAAGGHGITIVQTLSEIGYMGMVQLVSKWKKIVVSQYVSNPLLIEGLKFDMRLYVLVTSFAPLHIYLFSDGLARFCTEKYPTDGNVKDLLAHLTNTSLNCHSDNFKYSNDMNDKTGHTRSLAAVFEFLKSEGVNTSKVLADIQDLIVKTFSTIQPTVEKSVNANVPFKRNCFQLFGLDVLLDDRLKPWLLEVNGNPCMEPYTAMEVPIKARVVRDMFRIVGLHGKPNKHTKNRESRRKGDFSLIFPTSIAPKSSRRRKHGEKPSIGFAMFENDIGDIIEEKPIEHVEAAKESEKVEEKGEEKTVEIVAEKVEKEEVPSEKVEEKVDVTAPPMVPCC